MHNLSSKFFKIMLASLATIFWKMSSADASTIHCFTDCDRLCEVEVLGEGVAYYDKDPLCKKECDTEKMLACWMRMSSGSNLQWHSYRIEVQTDYSSSEGCYAFVIEIQSSRGAQMKWLS